MRARAVFPLWPRLHEEILAFLGLVPHGGLETTLPGSEMDLGSIFRHIAAVEDYWSRITLDGSAAYREISRDACPDAATLRAKLTEVFNATERLLDDSDVELLAARSVVTSFPVANGLEALSLCHLHTIHHRSEIASALRALGVDPRDWI